MSDIDEKKITFVSDTDVSIPIRWQSSATDIRWNNAIAMAVTIARTIDKMNLWDGYLDFIVRTNGFKVNKKRIKLNDTVSETLVFNKQLPIDITFNVNYLGFKITPKKIKLNNTVAENMPIAVEKSYSLDDTTIIIEFNNSIYSNDLNANLEAFSVTATFGGVMYTVHPTEIVQTGTSTLSLTISSLEQASGAVSILYANELGNLMSNATSEAVPSFNTSFTYTNTYSEGE